ncbi:MAG: histidine phosphatase family protein [Candidatus Limnocylindrales bacterium]
MNWTGEIELHLLRHAHAGDSMKWNGPDAVRPLTERGRLQSERLGLFLARAGFRPDAILSSPRIRALDTARLVAAPLGVPVIVVDELDGPLDVETIERILDSAGDPRRPMLVGHDPELSALAADLLGIPELALRKAALVRIDTRRPLEPGRGVIRWLLPPDLLAPGG